MKNKVLNVGPDYRYPNGGIAKLINTYSKIFDNFSFVSTMRAPEQGKEGKLKTFARMIGGLFRMSCKIISGKSEIVHIHTASGISFVRESIFLYLASMLGAKTILHMHSGSLVQFYEKHPKLVAATLNKADIVITIADVWKEYLNSKGHNNVITVGNPIPLPSPLTSSQNRLLNVLFLGLISENKGIWDILDVFKTHKDEWRNKIKLTIGGNGEVERLTKFIKDYELNQLVEYVGWIDGEKKCKIFSSSDIYLQPSYREALGIAILEAMSYKIPVIATETGGIPEIVHDRVNGLLIQPGDKNGLYEAINQLASSESMRKRFGEQGFTLAQQYYPEKIKEKLNKIYSEINERIY